MADANPTVVAGDPGFDPPGRVSISSGWGSILHKTGIDIREFPQVMDGTGRATVAVEGHMWTIEPWEGGGGYAVAWRPNTEQEERAERSRASRSTFVGYFGKDRLLMCLRISREIQHISSSLNPDRPPSRAKRRTASRKLKRLAEIQHSLMSSRFVSSEEFADELHKLGCA